MKNHHSGPPSADTPAMLKDRPQSPNSQQLADLAGKIQGARDRRKVFFESDLIAEPGWEILVAIYRAETECHRITVSNACRASNAPITTALRWIDRLTELNLIRRTDNPLDGRVVFLELEPKTKRTIEAYLNDLWLDLYL